MFRFGPFLEDSSIHRNVRKQSNISNVSKYCSIVVVQKLGSRKKEFDIVILNTADTIHFHAFIFIFFVYQKLTKHQESFTISIKIAFKISLMHYVNEFLVHKIYYGLYLLKVKVLKSVSWEIQLGHVVVPFLGFESKLIANLVRL